MQMMLYIDGDISPNLLNPILFVRRLGDGVNLIT